jgi:N-acetylmuramoyl-L-alanine amidase
VVKLLAIAAALLCALALLAGPALSGERWRPDAIDFELAAPPGAASASASGRVTSRPVRAPKRFNLVGLRWRGHAEPRVALRVRKRGERWTGWQPLLAHAEHNPDPNTGEPQVAASDPLWVGEADDVQYRLSRRVPGLRLHFVNVRGTATAGDRLRTGLRRTVNTATTSLAGLIGGGDAEAQEPMPDVVTRAEWGASQCKPRTKPSYGTVKAVYVHHTVTTNDYTPEEAPDVVLGVCRFHRNSNGWNDIGYNALVDKYGTLYEGRAGGLDKAVFGAQAEGYNDQTAGIASMGNNSEQAASPEELAALARFIRWKLGVHGIPTTGTTTLTSTGGASNRFPRGRKVPVPVVLGHRDTGATECPGNLLYGQLDDLRAQVASGVPLTGAGTSLTATVDQGTILYGSEVAVGGALLRADGSPAATQPVELQTMSDGSWRTARQVVTAADGSWLTSLKPRKRMYVRARFASGIELRGSSSAKLLLRVRPTLTLRRPATRARRGAKVAVSGLVAPRKRTVYVVLEQRIRGAWKRVGVRAVRARKGSFEGSFVPAYRARYRYAVVARPDLDTDRGASEPRVLRVTR